MTKMEAPFEKLPDQIQPPVNAIIADIELLWAVPAGRRRNIPVASLSTPQPLHADIDATKTNGIGPGMALAKAILVANRSGASGVIGLVPCAVGETDTAHMVFDMTTPPISTTDLLIASAGPGGFSTVEAICSVARSHGARVLRLTAQPETGSCVTHASVVGYVPAQTMANDADPGDVMESRPLLPMGSAYEGALFVLFEMVVYQLAEALGQSSPEAIRARHTNLE